MKKEQIRQELSAGKPLADILNFCQGEDCEIYKGNFASAKEDDVIYIPDIDLNELNITTLPTTDEIDEIINCCYSKKEFLQLCDGNQTLAAILFSYCNWEHPVSAMMELDEEFTEETTQPA